MRPTVVVHHKGRKKTTDSETAIAGSVAQATMENKMTKNNRKEVDLDFYRFQNREAQRNGIIYVFEIDLKVALFMSNNVNY